MYNICYLEPKAGEGIADLDVSECQRASEDNNASDDDEDEDDDAEEDQHGVPDIDDLDEEVRLLREENRALQHALGAARHSVASQRGAIIAVTQERDVFKKKVS